MFAGLRRKMKIHPPATITWSRVIGTFEALPEVYQPFFRQLQKTIDGEFPYLVLTPAAEKSIRKTPEQVICSANGTLYVVDNEAGNLSITAFPLSQITYIELGAILLFSWLTIHGIASDGREQSKCIEFNSVSSPHFNPILEKARRGEKVTGMPTYEREKGKFNFLTSSSFKFMNYARKSLVGDENVLDILWEPEIREQRFARLGLPFSRTKSYNHLSILTDRELILIREDEQTHSKENHYGGIWQFIPRKKLRSLSLLENSGENFLLQIALEGDTTALQLTFRNENRGRVEAFARKAQEAAVVREPALV